MGLLLTEVKLIMQNLVELKYEFDGIASLMSPRSMSPDIVESRAPSNIPLTESVQALESQ